MDKNLKKIKYQELFLSELRNSYFGEKKLEESLRELETKENMKKLAKALKNIWKKTDDDIKNLEKVFPKTELSEQPQETIVANNINTERVDDKKALMMSVNKSVIPKNLKEYQILSYENLVTLVDDLNTEQIHEILESASDQEILNHQYLTRLAEKLVRERDSKA